MWSLCSLYVPRHSEYKRTFSDNMEPHVYVTINPRILGGGLWEVRLYLIINLLKMFFRFSCLGKSPGDDNGPR